MAISATLTYGFSASYPKDYDLLGGNYNLGLSDSATFSQGTGIGQINVVYGNQFTFDGNSNQVVSLGTIDDVYNDSKALNITKAFWIKHISAPSDKDLHITPRAASGSNVLPWGGDELILSVDSVFSIVAPSSGWTMSTLNDTLDFELSTVEAGDVVFEFACLGVDT